MTISIAEPSGRYRRGRRRLRVGLVVALRGTGDLLVAAMLVAWWSLIKLSAPILFVLRKMKQALDYAWRQWIYPGLCAIGQAVLDVVDSLTRWIAAGWRWFARQKATKLAVQLLNVLVWAGALTVVVVMLLLGGATLLALTGGAIWGGYLVVKHISPIGQWVVLAAGCMWLLWVKDTREALNDDTNIVWDRYKVAARYWSDTRHAVRSLIVTSPSVVSREWRRAVRAITGVHSPKPVPASPFPKAAFAVVARQADVAGLSTSVSSRSQWSIALVSCAVWALSIVTVSVSNPNVIWGGITHALGNLQLVLWSNEHGKRSPSGSPQHQPTADEVTPPPPLPPAPSREALPKFAYALSRVTSGHFTWHAESPFVFEGPSGPVHDLNVMNMSIEQVCSADALVAVGLSSADGPARLNVELAFGRSIAEAKLMRAVALYACPKRSVPIFAIGYTARWQFAWKDTSAARPVVVYALSDLTVLSEESGLQSAVAARLQEDFGLPIEPGADASPDTECLLARGPMPLNLSAFRTCTLQYPENWLAAENEQALKLTEIR